MLTDMKIPGLWQLPSCADRQGTYAFFTKSRYWFNGQLDIYHGNDGYKLPSNGQILD